MSRWMRSITARFTGAVALLASLFGAPHSPRQYRSSIVIESFPTFRHRNPSTSDRRRPVSIAV
jgi:hypothetical protein